MRQPAETGYSVNGAYAEYVVADPNYVGRLPATMGLSEIAPVLCAGVTVYKGLKMLDCKPGDWVAISGMGGLGHYAVQYARAMGFHVVAVDIDDAKLDLARSLGAEMTINALKTDPVQEMHRNLRGAHGVLVTAVSRSAFSQAVGMLHKRGTVSLVGLPPGDFALPIFDVVLNVRTVRGSIVGTRQDLHVLNEMAYLGAMDPYGSYSGDVMGMMREGGEGVLAEAMAAAKIAGVPASPFLSDQLAQRLGEAVAEMAGNWKADLIVVGSHGRHGVRRLLLGSGAEQILRLSPVPVLVFRSVQIEPAVPAPVAVPEMSVALK